MAIDDYTTEARNFVTQCFDENSLIREDTVYQLSRLVASWMDTAARNQRNTEFYVQLLNQCADNLGPLKAKAFIQDDGGIVDRPLRLKLPELVAELAKMADQWIASQSAQKEASVSPSPFSNLPVE